MAQFTTVNEGFETMGKQAVPTQENTKEQRVWFANVLETTLATAYRQCESGAGLTAISLAVHRVHRAITEVPHTDWILQNNTDTRLELGRWVDKLDGLSQHIVEGGISDMEDSDKLTAKGVISLINKLATIISFTNTK